MGVKPLTRNFIDNENHSYVERLDGQVAKAVDLGTSSDNPLPVHSTESGFVSDDNSSYDTIAANGVFEGVWQDTLDYNNVIVGIKSTQDSIVDGLCVCWSSDGITIHDSDSFTISANTGKVFTFCPARRYFKIRYTNSVVEASVNIQTIFKQGGIKASSHRINDSVVAEDDAELVKSVLTGVYDDSFINIEASIGGALKTAIEDAQTARRVEIEPLGAIKSITPVRLVGTAFNNGTKDPNFWKETTTGSGVVTQDGQITLSTGLTADSSAIYDSVRKARKVPGSVNQFRMVGRLTTVPQADNVRRSGCYDSSDGYFFQFDGLTFGVGSRKLGVDTIVENGSFNGNYGSTIDAIGTSLTRFVIDYTSISARYFVNGVLLHTSRFETSSGTNTVDFPIRLENYNENGNDTNNSFQLRFATILRLGEFITNPAVKYINTNTTTVCKYGAGILHRLIIADNVGTIDVYDGTSTAGTLITELDTAQGTEPLGSVEFNAPFSNGLTIVTASGIEVTVVYE